MPSLCDVNFIFPLCYQHHTHHHLALDWLQTLDQAEQLVICRVSQLALLRLLCNRTLMKEEVMTLTDAWSVYDALMRDDRFVFRMEPEGVEHNLRKLTALDLPALQIWQDAYLAAFAIAANLQLITFDRGFRQFKGLDLLLLGA